jgi:hypothetical protein
MTPEIDECPVQTQIDLIDTAIDNLNNQLASLRCAAWTVRRHRRRSWIRTRLQDLTVARAAITDQLIDGLLNQLGLSAA